ncbi:MAG TPA: O-antigen ligase family protein [Flavitalea sp.]|nr:O-antigen ligase family protein [Flavitalea sp.]
MAFILVFFLYIPSWRAILQFERCVKFALLLGIPFCVFQLLYPSIYDSVFDPEGTRHLFKAGTFELQRLNGLFWHPSLTAFFTAFASFYFIYIVRNRLFAGLALVQLILTFERQEIATFFILIFLTFYMYSNRLYRIRVLLLISTMVAIAISLYYDAIASYLSVALRTTSLNDIASSDEPRIIIYWRGILLAYQHFPFGVGFGNYGGFAAVKYDAVLYHNFHFDQLWWFKDEAFLTDTYYPHIYAEAGIIGFVFYSLSLFCIFKLFYSSVKFPKLRGAIFFCILFLFTVALTAPVLNNPFSLSILGVFLAVIRRINIDKVLQETKLRSANNSGQLSCLALNTDDGKDLKTDAQKA